MTARLKAELELAWNATSEAEALAEARAHALAAAEKRAADVEASRVLELADAQRKLVCPKSEARAAHRLGSSADSVSAEIGG